jgi:Zn-finger nucleic acid-binding protein
LEAKKYVEIEEAYTGKYGWENGLDNFITIKRNFWLDNNLAGKTIEDLTMSQEYQLINRYRSFYNKISKEKGALYGKKKKKSSRES